MSEAMQSTDELAEATERVLTQSEWVIDGVPAEIESVGRTVDGEVDIRTTAGMFTKSEWHAKMCDGEINKL